MLLDTNVVIYLNGGSLPAHVEGRLHSSMLSTCNVVVAEVLGYRTIAEEDALYFKRLFAAMHNYPFDGKVTEKVRHHRSSRRLAEWDCLKGNGCPAVLVSCS